ncbi:MAG: flagellar basal body P-ring formation chaperone FlgA [Opitutales bacterium]|nr:flagellar basal body P-ring formation chaperone FlgA [Opitutales bacterium]
MNRLIKICLLLFFPLSVTLGNTQLSLESLLKPFEARPKGVTEPPPAKEAEPVAEISKSEDIKITQDDAVKALLETSQAALHEDDSIEITIRSGFQSTTLSHGTEWRLFTSDQFAPNSRGRWMPSLLLEVDGEIKQRWRLTCDIDLYRTVFMTTQRLARGETPMKPGLKPVIANIYNESSRPVPAYEDLNDYEMVRNLGEGRFLTWDDISPRRAIRKGETVDVILDNGQLQITMRAMSLEDGLVDEEIRLRNPRTRAEFTGVITKPGLVTVTN